MSPASRPLPPAWRPTAAEMESTAARPGKQGFRGTHPETVRKPPATSEGRRRDHAYDLRRRWRAHQENPSQRARTAARRDKKLRVRYSRSSL